MKKSKKISKKLPADLSQPVWSDSVPTVVAQTGYSVKKAGAKGDGLTDDTAAIQKALSGYSEVYFPDGVYVIDAEKSLFPKSNQKLTFASGAKLVVKPNAAASYNLFKLLSVTNVGFFGGNLMGDRSKHKGTTGESGMGININAGSQRITINGTRFSDFWGDGIYVGGSIPPSDIVIDSVECDNNRRQGLSVVNARKVSVLNSVFKNTNGTDPQSGIDIEPNAGQSVSDLLIENVKCIKNTGKGIMINGHKDRLVTGVQIKNSSVEDNTSYGLWVTGTKSIKVEDCDMSGNDYGILLEYDVANAALARIKAFQNKKSGVCVTSWKGGMQNITFADSEFFDNGLGGTSDGHGALISGGSAIISLIYTRCKFINNKKYGLSLYKYADSRNPVVLIDPVFSGNAAGKYSGNAIVIKKGTTASYTL